MKGIKTKTYSKINVLYQTETEDNIYLFVILLMIKTL